MTRPKACSVRARAPPYNALGLVVRFYYRVRAAVGELVVHGKTLRAATLI